MWRVEWSALSIYWVAMWTAKLESLAEHDDMLRLILNNFKEKHPLVLSARAWKTRVGSEPARPGYIWMEEFASSQSMDESEASETIESKKIWGRFHTFVEPGTFHTAIWSDAMRESWKESC